VDAFEVQRDIVHYLEIHDMLVQWLSDQWLPKFKLQKAQTYRKIMREFAKLEIANSQRLGNMWGRVLTHHKN